jgi:hypothetical protein
MYTHNDPPISRKVEQYKPALDADTMEWRVEFCAWALKELENGALFVNSDETYHSIGGHPHKKQKITTWKGEPAEFLATSAEDVKFTYMFWGGCCEDCSIPRPYFIWEEETDEERKAAQDELDTRNAEGYLEVERKRAKALVPGTPEWALLQHHNDLIDWMNAN